MFAVFRSIFDYIKDVLSSARSVWISCMTAIPYLFNAGDYRKEVTEQYPDPISSRTPDDLPPRNRGLLYNDIEKCTGCRECEKVCPTRCFHIETEPGADSGKIWVATFNIDYSRCTFCGLCVDLCTPQSLAHSRQYEGAVYDLRDLVTSFGRGHVTPEQREKWAIIRRQNENDELYP